MEEVEEDKAEDCLLGTMEDVEEESDLFCFSLRVVMSSESSSIRFLKMWSCVGVEVINWSGYSNGSELLLKGSSSLQRY